MIELGLDKLSKTQKIIYSSLFGILIIYLYWIYFISPTLDEIDSTNNAIKIKSLELQKAETLANKEAIIKNQLQSLKTELQEARKVLPTEKEVDILLDKLSELAQGSGIVINSFQPGAEDNKGEYIEVPMHIDGSGKFASLGTFLSKLTEFSRLVKVVNIRINSNNDRKVPINFSVDLSTYRVSQ